MAKAQDLAMLAEEELEERLVETRREVFNLRFQLATGQLDNSARLPHARRDVARMLTVLREREIAEAEGTWVEPTAEQQEQARAHLAAEAEAEAAADEARRRRRKAEVEGRVDTDADAVEAELPEVDGEDEEEEG